MMPEAWHPARKTVIVAPIGGGRVEECEILADQNRA
jgi:hypothetical protein